MPSEFEEQHLHYLHMDVVACFERIADALARTGELGVTWEGTEQDTADARERLRGHIQSVTDLELLMPVVAPVKAGKSTVVNAVIGYELLPARSNPMTTVPTRIVIEDGRPLDKPVLTLPEYLLRLLADTEVELREALARDAEVPKDHAYMQDLADAIADGSAVPMRSSYEGVDDVQKALMRLNDQLRLATVLAPTDFFGGIHDLPTLFTGTSHTFLAGQAARGRLVIIDTPGPNEEVMGTRLGRVVEQQLGRSHVILVVLDYMQMGSTAEQETRAKLTEHLGAIGRERLLAVVNKIDARRRPEDLSREDTRAKVFENMGFTDAGRDARVFEVAAHYGLAAARVLMELDADPGMVPADSRAACDMMRLYQPLLSQEEAREELELLTVAQLRLKAERLFAKSAVKPLLDTAIGRLRSEAGPESLRAGVSRFRAGVARAREVLLLELKATEASQKTVADQLKQLDREMDELKKLRKDLPAAGDLPKKFKKELNRVVDELKDAGKEIVEALDGKPADDALLSRLPSQVSSIIRSTARYTEKVLWHGRPAEPTAEFQSEKEASAFIDKMAGAAVQGLRSAVDRAHADLDHQVQILTGQVIAEHEAKARKVITRAALTLGSAFGVTLAVPEPKVGGGELEVTLSGPEVRTDHRYEKYETEEMKRRWFTGFLVKRPKMITHTRVVEEKTFIVSKDDVKKQLKKAFEEEIARMALFVENYVATDISNALTTYYNELDQYLQGYHSALTRTVDGSARDEVERAARRADLEAVDGRLREEAAELARFAEQLGLPAA